MKKEHLIEFLRSIIEEDAIISRIWMLFYQKYHYSFTEINEIIEYGLDKEFFLIEDVQDKTAQFTKINWRSDNVQQEITMNYPNRFIKMLFSNHPQVPFEFTQFIK